MVQRSIERFFSHLAADVYSHGVRELEGVEESVSDDTGPTEKCYKTCVVLSQALITNKPRVGSCDLHELADHLGAQDTAVLVRELDRPGVLGVGRAGLHPHVKLACRRKCSQC